MIFEAVLAYPRILIGTRKTDVAALVDGFVTRSTFSLKGRFSHDELRDKRRLGDMRGDMETRGIFIFPRGLEF